MREEREFAGFALPFVTGIFTAVLAGGYLVGFRTVSATSSLLLTAVFLVLLIHPSRRNFNDFTTLLLIMAAACSAGLLCGFTSFLTEASRLPLTFTARIGEAMAESIDSIPFSKAETNAIIKALITGDRHDIPVSVTDSFRKSGASHILALSGLHLGIIYAVVSRILGCLGNSPSMLRVRSIAIVILCGTYMMATGAGDSIVRAFLFILLGEAAKLTNRRHDTATLFFAAICIQLCIDPQSCMSIGFQLSYAAVAGIAFIFPWLRSFWPASGKKGPLRWIWESAALSISCQITTGPLAWHYFGTFPQHFLLTNLIAIPFAGLIIPAALLCMASHPCGLCPEILLRATEALVTALSEALNIISLM